MIGTFEGIEMTEEYPEPSALFDLSNDVAVVTGGVLATLVAGLIFAWRPLSVRPAAVLRASE